MNYERLYELFQAVIHKDKILSPRMEQWNEYKTKLRYLRTRGKNALPTEILINIPYKIYEVKDYSS